MEILKPQEVIGEGAKLALSGLRFVASQLKGGAWGELGAQYGEAVGGHEPHQPTILPPTAVETAIDLPKAA